MSRYKTDDAARFAVMVGANIKFLRLRKKDFSPMKMIAYHLGITHQQVAKYESGKNMLCTYRLTQLADYYKVKLDDLVNPDFINQQSKTPQDAGYLKPQKDIGSLEEIKGDKDWIVGNNQNPQILVGSLDEIKDKLIKDGIDPEETILPTLRNAAKKELN